MSAIISYATMLAKQGENPIQKRALSPEVAPAKSCGI
jgi:hypothetical protein